MPPLMLSQATHILSSGIFTGGAIIPPPSLAKGSMKFNSPEASEILMSLCLPFQGAGERQLRD